MADLTPPPPPVIFLMWRYIAAHDAWGGGCTGGGGMHVHPVHPPWVRPCFLGLVHSRGCTVITGILSAEMLCFHFEVCHLHTLWPGGYMEGSISFPRTYCSFFFDIFSVFSEAISIHQTYSSCMMNIGTYT